MIRADIKDPDRILARIRPKLLATPQPADGPQLPTPCWVWQGAKDASGYGATSATIKGWTQTILLHRLMVALSGREAPEKDSGKALDHLCRVRACCNPTHLECVDWDENTRRGEGVTAQKARQTHCKNGHPLEGDNLRIRMRNGRPSRGCKQCGT